MTVDDLIALLERHPGDATIVLTITEALSYDDSLVVYSSYPTVWFDERTKTVRIGDL